MTTCKTEQKKMKSSSIWKPGQSGNPRGRPRKDRALADLLRKFLGQPLPDISQMPPPVADLYQSAVALWKKENIQKYQDLFVAKLILEATIGKDAAARREILDRVDGKVSETLDITTDPYALLPLPVLIQNRLQKNDEPE
ncbi:DUF5681 domain-containing protein [Thermogutta sp.]|uniref:DUF5681 domain-containing protein n=1 Tax=Thermogutta sp. TaxID=1962930 RepID=UPI00321F9E74